MASKIKDLPEHTRKFYVSLIEGIMSYTPVIVSCVFFSMGNVDGAIYMVLLGIAIRQFLDSISSD